MSTIDSIETPALLLERARLARNVERMEARVRSLGVALRPHLKTCKSIEVAATIPSARSHGITVSTVKEAEYFATAGFRDQLLAVALAPSRIARVTTLLRDGVRVRLAVDALAPVEWLAAAGTPDAPCEALVEIDCGEHRSGLLPEAPELLTIAERLRSARNTRFGGVFTHAGHSYAARGSEAIAAVAEAERRALIVARERLEAAGFEVPIVSAGSTPTATHARTADGLTEIRAGVYVFQDVFQAAIGNCTTDDIAVSVLATVIGHQPAHGRLLIDAGGLALSKDRSTAALGRDGDCGYGLVADPRACVPYPTLRVTDVYQEHGVVTSTDGHGPDFARFPLGSRVRVLPNHACMTCSAYDSYQIVEDGRVVARWPRIHEWSPA